MLVFLGGFSNVLLFHFLYLIVSILQFGLSNGDPVTLKLTITNPELTEFTDWIVEYVDITIDQRRNSHVRSIRGWTCPSENLNFDMSS